MAEIDKEQKKAEEIIINNDKDILLGENGQILNKLDELLALNKQIASSTNYLKKRFRIRWIANIVKWLLLVVVLFLGFLSLSSVFDFVRKNIDDYENKFNYILEKMDYNNSIEVK